MRQDCTSATVSGADLIFDIVKELSNDVVSLSTTGEQLIQKLTQNKNAETKWERGIVENRQEIYLDPDWQDKIIMSIGRRCTIFRNISKASFEKICQIKVISQHGRK